MARKTRALEPGERVTILAGDERGGWGIVALFASSEEVHVKVYGGEARMYERRELRRERTARTARTV